MCCPNTTRVNCRQERVYTCVVFAQDPPHPPRPKKRKIHKNAKSLLGAANMPGTYANEWEVWLCYALLQQANKSVCTHSPLLWASLCFLLRAASSSWQAIPGFSPLKFQMTDIICLRFWKLRVLFQLGSILAGVSDWRKNNVRAIITRHSFLCNAQSDLPAMSQ